MGRVREKSRLFDEPAWNCRWMRRLLCRIVRIMSIRVVTASLFQLNGVLHIDAVCMIHPALLLDVQVPLEQYRLLVLTFI